MASSGGSSGILKKTEKMKSSAQAAAQAANRATMQATAQTRQQQVPPEQPNPTPPRKPFPWKWALIGGFAATVLVGIVGAALVLVAASSDGSESLFFGDCVGVVSISGEIGIDNPTGFLGKEAAGASSEKIAEILKGAQGEEKYYAVLLDINSPGGSAVASKRIYDAVRKLRTEGNKTVVAYLGEVAASGGYYVASAADEIVADPNTLTGSIGARFDMLNYAGLLGKLGISDDSVKSGAMKDIGSGTRNMTAQERKLLQDIIAETAKNFENDVRAGRAGKTAEPHFSQALDARVLSPQMALRAGLVDRIGTKDDAIEVAYRLSHGGNAPEGEPEACKISQAGFWGEMFGDAAERFGRGVGFSLAQYLGAKSQNLATGVSYG